MKQKYYVGVFTYNGDCFTEIREYSSISNADDFFRKYFEKKGYFVIYSCASVIEKYATFNDFHNEVRDKGFCTIKEFYPERYYDLFVKQRGDK